MKSLIIIITTLIFMLMVKQLYAQTEKAALQYVNHTYIVGTRNSDRGEYMDDKIKHHEANPEDWGRC
ncbi:MAG: hypothetical protein A2V67_17005 [Deltaproteobacteria bacterium RBG_13_61_14]|nr:MAG: hypothetical protein A2V67_17005 [Deltaproteobacteria bacterium RBG_13_61_14]